MQIQDISMLFMVMEGDITVLKYCTGWIWIITGTRQYGKLNNNEQLVQK